MLPFSSTLAWRTSCAVTRRPLRPGWVARVLLYDNLKSAVLSGGATPSAFTRRCLPLPVTTASSPARSPCAGATRKDASNTPSGRALLLCRPHLVRSRRPQRSGSAMVRGRRRRPPLPGRYHAERAPPSPRSAAPCWRCRRPTTRPTNANRWRSARRPTLASTATTTRCPTPMCDGRWSRG